VCYELFSTPSFFRLLLSIDQDIASTARQAGCQCGGTLHRAAYPRKPRGVPAQERDRFITRLSFCCASCRKRTTPASVRFLGRRVYVGLVLTLVSQRKLTPRAMHPVLQALSISRRTLDRWRQWWREDFRLTPLWQLGRARFIPPVVESELPESLRHRFEIADHDNQFTQLLRFLSPLSTRILSRPAEVL
jgi:hypothetical protein